MESPPKFPLVIRRGHRELTIRHYTSNSYSQYRFSIVSNGVRKRHARSSPDAAIRLAKRLLKEAVENDERTQFVPHPDGPRRNPGLEGGATPPRIVVNPWPGWMSLQLTARYCCVTPRTVRSWLKRTIDPLPHSKPGGGKILIRRESLDRWMEDQL